jgi:hypothetical protein
MSKKNKAANNAAKSENVDMNINNESNNAETSATGTDAAEHKAVVKEIKTDKFGEFQVIETKFGKVKQYISGEKKGELVPMQGRSIDPTSERQLRLAKMAENGTIGKRGRPSDPNSERAQRLAKQKAEQDAGIVRKQGRPMKEDSERQKQLAAREARVAMFQSVLAEEGLLVTKPESDESTDSAE